MENEEKVLFLVTSAIKVPTGDVMQRYAETLSTINSINNKFKNCDIWLLESGSSFTEEVSSLFPPNVKLIDFWKDPKLIDFIKESKEFADHQVKLYKNDWKFFYLGYVKNVTESYVLDQIFSNNDFSEYARIFKLSGRYCLTPTFDPLSFNSENKFTIYKAIKTNQGKSKIRHYHLCFLWSCCGKEIETLKKVIKGVKKDVHELMAKREFIDIEHALYKNIPQSKKQEISKLGVYAKVNGENWLFV